MNHFPSKSGRLPSDPIFTRLVQIARDILGIRIHDEYRIDADCRDLLNDILQLRDVLRQQLPSQWFDHRGILRPETSSIATITYSGYYFFVAFFAITSIGGRCVPLSTAYGDEELHFLSTCNANYLLSEPNTSELASKIKRKVGRTFPLRIIPITRSPASARSCQNPAMEVDERLILSPDGTCLVMFTSGTTGKFKGAAIPRRRFSIGLQVDYESEYLACRPLHWIGGASRAIIQVLRGGKLFSMKHHRRSPTDIWECLKEHDITYLNLSSEDYRRLRDHYTDVLQQLPEEKRQPYMFGVSKVRETICGGSVLDKSTAGFWRKVTNTAVMVNYASTELGGTATTTEPDAQYKHRCIGRPIPGVHLKLSNGDSGEILVKSPGIFTHYVGDEAATKAAFDEDGFFKTGDLGRLVDGQYFFEGRKKSDYIRFRCFEISVLELEERLLELPYVSEAYILPVLDYDEKGLPAALIHLHKSSRQACSFSKQKINLRRIRHDLESQGLERYKLPRLLRILEAGENVPRTASQKVLKKQALKKFFHIDGYRPVDYCVEGVEFWGGAYDAL